MTTKATRQPSATNFPFYEYWATILINCIVKRAHLMLAVDFSKTLKSIWFSSLRVLSRSSFVFASQTLRKSNEGYWWKAHRCGLLFLNNKIIFSTKLAGDFRASVRKMGAGGAYSSKVNAKLNRHLLHLSHGKCVSPPVLIWKTMKMRRLMKRKSRGREMIACPVQVHRKTLVIKQKIIACVYFSLFSKHNFARSQPC